MNEKRAFAFMVAGYAAMLSNVSTAAAETGLMVVPQAKLHWEHTPEGVAFAALEGDRFKESYMAMVRLPGGLSSPVHTKSAGMFGIVVSGSMVHIGAAESGADTPILTAGDYYRIPADLAHVSKCVSQEECVTFLYQDGPFDFLPVQENSK